MGLPRAEHLGRSREEVQRLCQVQELKTLILKKETQVRGHLKYLKI